MDAATPRCYIGLLIVMGLLAGLTCSHPSHELSDKFIKSFSHKVVMASCYTPSIVTQWYKWANDIVHMCHHERKEAGKRHEDRRTNSRHETTDNAEDGAVFFSASKVGHIKEVVMKKIDIINCTLNKMNISLTPEGTINVTDHVIYYQELELPAELKKDTIQGLKDCANDTDCHHHESSFGPAGEDFLKKVSFAKCEKESRMLACVRHHLRLTKDEYDLTALDGELETLNMDDEDKMLAIITHYADHYDTDQVFL